MTIEESKKTTTQTQNYTIMRTKTSWFKGFMYVVVLLLYAMGVVGGIGYACYNHAYLIAVGVAAVALMALPQVVKYFKALTE